MKIRALIVDDEQLARQRVRLLLGEEPDVEVIGESGDGFEAVDEIQATKPDLVFLDVQMPDMDGFEVLRRVPQASLPFVICTGLPLEAIQAQSVQGIGPAGEGDHCQQTSRRCRPRASHALGSVSGTCRSAHSIGCQNPRQGHLRRIRPDPSHRSRRKIRCSACRQGESCPAREHDFVGIPSSLATILAHQPVGNRQY